MMDENRGFDRSGATDDNAQVTWRRARRPKPAPIREPRRSCLNEMGVETGVGTQDIVAAPRDDARLLETSSGPRLES